MTPPPRPVSQTLFAVLALSVLALLGLSRSRGAAADERATIGRAIEMAALGVSERWGGELRDAAFDESDLSADDVRLRDNVDGLTMALGTEPGEDPADWTTFDDVDDFDGAATRDTVAVGDGEVVFDVSYSVVYVDPDTFAPAGRPTTTKLATVIVREIGAGRGGRPPVRVETPIRVTPTKQALHG